MYVCVFLFLTLCVLYGLIFFKRKIVKGFLFPLNMQVGNRCIALGVTLCTVWAWVITRDPRDTRSEQVPPSGRHPLLGCR